MENLQKEFFLQNTLDVNPTAPFLDLRLGEIDTLLEKSAYRTERWRKGKSAGMEKDELLATFLNQHKCKYLAGKVRLIQS